MTNLFRPEQPYWVFCSLATFSFDGTEHEDFKFSGQNRWRTYDDARYFIRLLARGRRSNGDLVAVSVFLYKRTNDGLDLLRSYIEDIHGCEI